MAGRDVTDGRVSHTARSGRPLGDKRSRRYQDPGSVAGTLSYRVPARGGLGPSREPPQDFNGIDCTQPELDRRPHLGASRTTCSAMKLKKQLGVCAAESRSGYL